MSLYETWWQSFFGTGNKEFSGYSKTEEEVELFKCNNGRCKTMMEYHDHYVNGGLCFKCIMNIGK